MNRWHCTGGDVLAAATLVSSCLFMVVLYAIYAKRNHQSLAKVKQSSFRSHLIELRNVFVACGAIHALNSIIGWFVPLHYIAAIAMLGNSIQCLYLLRSKKEILAIEQHTQGIRAVESIEDLKAIISQAQSSGIQEQIRQLEDALSRMK